ncbi:ribosome assembly factor SBDS [Desulfurococcus amylolyticus]|uniref:Shwachman-Bodian-Diamond syndrome protein-like protein n=1 Tax=Desulfurococcus amylolyticus (strain DSM 18924 / JCM 16383 / VKM B-2413 / 1221n) TaxID=490899 RepID=B8D6C1_DESA1|nr:ribosome assembly factor SBDS [Desulfurococcus amylolyticus]ACL11652.1 Shwachman-Bodian-Diamond syndrome protein - like protein [Desulfurococcus amylolyticus 1221n]
MKDKLVIARYEAKGHRFEILVDPELALKIKEGKQISIDEVVAGDFIYKDARKGLKASPESMKEVFGTDDPKVVAVEIIKRGELQLTAEQRRKFIEEKRAQILNLIARNAIDPKTKLPIPVKRLELAMEQARISIDPYKPAEQQMEHIVSQLAKVIPIKIAKAYVAVRIPSEYASRSLKQIQAMGTTKKVQWREDGSLYVELEIPAGLQQELIDKVNALTKGSGEVKILNVG